MVMPLGFFKYEVRAANSEELGFHLEFPAAVLPDLGRSGTAKRPGSRRRSSKAHAQRSQRGPRTGRWIFGCGRERGAEQMVHSEISGERTGEADSLACLAWVRSGPPPGRRMRTCLRYCHRSASAPQEPFARTCILECGAWSPLWSQFFAPGSGTRPCRPSTTTSRWPAAVFSIVWRPPPSQRISIRSARSWFPRPKCKRVPKWLW